MRNIRYAVVATLLLVAQQRALAFSILGHRIVALRLLDAARQDPSRYPELLSRIAADPTLTAYFLGGTEAPDFGALKMQQPRIQYSTHYEHPALWIRLLFENARDDNERAFVYGWVVHEAADLQIHPWMDAHGLNYCEHAIEHPFFECAIDSAVAAGVVDCDPYRKPENTRDPLPLLNRVHALVRQANAHSAGYDDYVDAVHHRCKVSGGDGDDDIDPTQTDSLELFRSTKIFDAVKTLELMGGTHVEKSVESDHLRSFASWTTSPTLKEIGVAVADALDSDRAASCSRIGPSASSELAQFYDVSGASMRDTLWAAARGDWHALDRNFDTGVAVNDPALDAATQSQLDVALVLDSSGSMRDSDPNELRKAAAELLIDRAPANTRFTVVRFDHRVSALAERTRDRTTLDRAIASIGADGGTLICQATNFALNELAGGDGAKAIVLLTDGKSQDACDAAELARGGIRIFTVGLSEEANGAMLQAIAAATGGLYVHARTAADVQGVFDTIIGQLAGEASVADMTGTAKPGATSELRFVLDKTIRTLSVLLTWPGSRLDLTLVSPSGKRVTATSEGRAAGTYQLLRVDGPAAGTWTALVKSIEVAPGGEPFRIRAAAATPVRVALEPLPSLGASMRAVPHGFPAGDPHVAVRVERPDGRVEAAEVTKDENGFVATYGRTDTPGAYNFVWTVATGDVTRFATGSVFLGATNAQGGSVQSVDGQYVRWDRGALYGLHSGLPVRIVRNGEPIATGRVIDVRRDDSDIELDTVNGLNDVLAGDSVEVEMNVWTADAPP